MRNETLSLRQRAEEFLHKHPEAIKGITLADVKKLVEDLHLHQMELEIRNEELRRAQSELEASRDRYSDLYDFAPVGYVTISEHGLILQVNLTCAEMLGAERIYLIGRPLSHFIVKDDQNNYYLFRKNLLESGSRQAAELKLLKKGGTQFYARMEGMTVIDSEENMRMFRIAVTDITKRKEAEEALKKAHNELELRVQQRTE
ncbi:MAG: PAS domain-containing protein, partial [Desulfobacterales bacterium]